MIIFFGMYVDRVGFLVCICNKNIMSNINIFLVNDV